MDVDRRTVIELTIAVLIIVSFTAAVYYVSGAYAAPDNGTNGSVPPSLEPAGGVALVATLGLFIVLVGVAGLFVYRQDFDDD